MRYLLQSSLSRECSARIKYLYDTLNLWFSTSSSSDTYTTLLSMPSSAYSDIIFIVGHNYFVRDYLINNNVPEMTIVAITCIGGCNFESLRLPPNKHLFLPILNNDRMAELLDGRKFGFAFDITESELLFFNSPKNHSLSQRISESFQKLH